MPTQAQRTAHARRRLLDATAALIAEHGVANTSVAAIGELAEMSRGAANFHFGSKEELVLALTEEVVVDIEGRITHAAAELSTGTVEEFTDSVLQSYLDLMRSDPTRARLLEILAFEAIGPSPHLRDLVARLFRRTREHLTTTILALRDRGAVAADVDAGGSALLMIAACRGITAQQLLDPDAVDLDAAIGEARRALLATLRP